MKGEVVAVCRSDLKGTRKTPQPSGVLREDWGLLGDAHAGPGRRQVSLLAEESMEKMRRLGLQVGPGDFAENITVRGLQLHSFTPGTRLKVGEALLEITQIGKECHTGCAIFRQTGKCIMPSEGVFAKVLKGGTVRPGDEVAVLAGTDTP